MRGGDFHVYHFRDKEFTSFIVLYDDHKLRTCVTCSEVRMEEEMMMRSQKSMWKNWQII